MKKVLCLAFVGLFVGSFWSCTEEDHVVRKTIDFQNLNLEPESYWNGSDESGGFTILMANFNNDFNSEWDAWSGFAYSNITDVETPGWLNQYSAYQPDATGDNIYAVSYVFGESATITFDFEVNIVAAKFTNSTYAYLAIRDGNEYSQPFAEGDWFKLIVKGYDEEGNERGEVEFYLADFRSGDGYIVDRWERVNLNPLNGVVQLVFHLESSDEGDWGMNTPAYFCMDDLEIEHMN